MLAGFSEYTTNYINPKARPFIAFWGSSNISIHYRAGIPFVVASKEDFSHDREADDSAQTPTQRTEVRNIGRYRRLPYIRSVGYG